MNETGYEFSEEQRDFVREIITIAMVDDPELIQQLSDTLNSQLIKEAGKAGFRKGWKNIPPYSIAVLSRKTKPTSAQLWCQGWQEAKNSNHDANLKETL